jgi:hypothetical protein
MRQDRFLIAILAGIGVLVVLSVALFIARRGTLAYGPEDTPEGVTRNFIVAVKKGDYDRAYAYLGEIENKPDSFAFRQTYQQFQASEVASTGVEVGQTNMEGEKAYVQMSMLRGGGGLFNEVYRDQQSAELVLESGAWKIKAMPYPFWNYSWTETVKPDPAP